MNSIAHIINIVSHFTGLKILENFNNPENNTIEIINITVNYRMKNF